MTPVAEVSTEISYSHFSFFLLQHIPPQHYPRRAKGGGVARECSQQCVAEPLEHVQLLSEHHSNLASRWQSSVRAQLGVGFCVESEGLAL